MNGFAHQAEMQKLALLLNLPVTRLAYLERLDTRTLRALREQTTAALFEADAELFGRLATATRLLPAAISAVIAEKALGSLLCARIAGQLLPQRAADIAKRLPSEFLADVCTDINPQQIRELIALMPIARILDVTRIMLRRKSYIIMARFVDCLNASTMRTVLDALPDDDALLRIGFYVEDPRQLDPVIVLFSAERLRNIIGNAIDQGAELWREVLALIGALGETPRQQMATQAATLEDAQLQRSIVLTDQQGLWGEIAPLLRAWTPEQGHRIYSQINQKQPQLAQRLSDALHACGYPTMVPT